MKRLSITQLVPGMTVAEDVYDLDHELLMQKGTVLTDKLITKLDLYGILTIFAEDIIHPVQPVEDPTDTELSYSERIKSSPEFQLFKTDFENDVELFRENMNLVIQKNTTLDVNTLLKNTMAIVANHSGSISILDMLQNMREYDDSTYTHSLNVALICNILAGWLKLSDKEVELATACGLFHDIGKLDELAAFPANDYTDDGQLLGHIMIGAEMVHDGAAGIPGFPEQLENELKHCILAHHGELEYGSPKKPALAEALALNLADNTDARMETLTEVLAAADDSGEWLGYNRIFESNIRKTGEI